MEQFSAKNIIVEKGNPKYFLPDGTNLEQVITKLTNDMVKLQAAYTALKGDFDRQSHKLSKVPTDRIFE